MRTPWPPQSLHQQIQLAVPAMTYKYDRTDWMLLIGMVAAMVFILALTALH